jgi:hypothetical protein
VHELPTGPEPAPERLEGKAAIVDYLTTVPERVGFHAIDVPFAREVDGELMVEAHRAARSCPWC